MGAPSFRKQERAPLKGTHPSYVQIPYVLKVPVQQPSTPGFPANSLAVLCSFVLSPSFPTDTHTSIYPILIVIHFRFSRRVIASSGLFVGNDLLAFLRRHT